MFEKTLPLYKAAEMPPCIALYGVYDESELVYIGSATCLRRRFKSHLFAKKFAAHCVVKWREYSEADIEKLSADEKKAIKELSPRLNKVTQGAIKTRKTWPLYGKKARERSNFHQVVYDLLWLKIENSISKVYVLENIALKTDLSYSWLEKFAQDTGGSPAVDRLERLYECLSGEKLEIKKAN